MNSTDPREEEPKLPYVFKTFKGHCENCETPFEIGGLILDEEKVQSTNSNLAAEIAELKAWRNEAEGKLIECGREIANHVAKLEAARKERDEAKSYGVEKLAERDAARDELARISLQLHQAYAILQGHQVPESEVKESGLGAWVLIEQRHMAKQRDTALAAKDASEKRVAELDGFMTWIRLAVAEWNDPNHYLYNAGRVIALYLPALTPAPTQEPPACPKCFGTGWIRKVGGKLKCECKQEPPAGGKLVFNDKWNDPEWLKEYGGPTGGVTISNDSPDLLARRQEQSETAGGTSNAPRSEAVTSSNSPADVPSEGRGEWMPIETLDKSKMQFVLIHDDGQQRALLWNPRGYWEHPHPAGQRYDGNPTEWMELPPNPILPTEGSGA